MAKKALYWHNDFQKYSEYVLPEGVVLTPTSFDVEATVRCAKCGKELPFGKTYTSQRIQTELGIGYPECGDCYWEYKDSVDRVR